MTAAETGREVANRVASSFVPRALKIVGLSPREKEVIELVASGLSQKQIAVRLSISVGTIKVHKRNIALKSSNL